MNKNDLKKYLPRDKCDIESIEQLIMIGLPTIKPLIPDLLEWTEDYNWPVAMKLIPFLADNAREIISELDSVFDFNDAIWSYWILSQVIAKQPDEVLIRFEVRIEKLSSIQTFDVDEIELRDIVIKLLDRIGNSIS